LHFSIQPWESSDSCQTENGTRTYIRFGAENTTPNNTGGGWAVAGGAKHDRTRTLR
jgi:hypothetical protein